MENTNIHALEAVETAKPSRQSFLARVKAKRTALLMAVMSLVLSLAVSADDGTTATTKLSTIVTADMVKGVLDEVVGLLPVLIPALISFIALRKGISFIQSVLHSA